MFLPISALIFLLQSTFTAECSITKHRATYSARNFAKSSFSSRHEIWKRRFVDWYRVKRIKSIFADKELVKQALGHLFHYCLK